MSAAGGGFLWTGLSTLINFSVHIIIISFLTTNLEPSEFGKISVLLIIYGLFQLFSGLGLTNYIISNAAIKKQQLNNIFWINTVFGFIIAIFIFLLSDLISQFFGDSSLRQLIEKLSFSFLLIPIWNIYLNILRKALKFKAISIIEIASRISWATALVVMVLNGTKAESFVYATYIQVFILGLLFFIKGKAFFVPKFSFQIEGLGPIVQYGIYQMGEALLNYLAKESDKIILGNTLGITALGIYSVYRDISFRLGNLFVFTFARVTFPILSKVQQESSLFKKQFLLFFKIVTISLSTLYFGFYISKNLLTSFIIKGEYANSVFLLIYFAVLFFVRFSSAPISTLWLSKNRPDIGFKWNLLIFIFNPIIIYFSSLYGIESMLISLIVAQMIWWILSYKIVQILTRISFKDYSKTLLYCLAIFALNYIVFSFFIQDLSINETFKLLISTILFLSCIFISFFFIDNDTYIIVKSKLYEIYNSRKLFNF